MAKILIYFAPFKNQENKIIKSVTEKILKVPISFPLIFTLMPLTQFGQFFKLLDKKIILQNQSSAYNLYIRKYLKISFFEPFSKLQNVWDIFCVDFFIASVSISEATLRGRSIDPES